MYYLVGNIEELNEAATCLEHLKFEKSKFSVDEADAKAIATFISEDERHYILLSENMMTDDPGTSWITRRRQVFSLSELVDKIMDTIYFFVEKRYLKNQ